MNPSCRATFKGFQLDADNEASPCRRVLTPNLNFMAPGSPNLNLNPNPNPKPHPNLNLNLNPNLNPNPNHNPTLILTLTTTLP